MKFTVLAFLLLAIPATLSSAANKCEPTRVAVIDTGLDLKDPRFLGHICPTGHKNFVENETLDDVNNHGTFVAGLIQEYAKDANYCLLIYKYYQESAPASVNLKHEIESIREAVANGADVVNFSGGGEGFNEEEALLIKYHPDITFVVAAGNEGKDLDIPGNEYYPASYFYLNEIVVSGIDRNGARVSSSNYSKNIEDKELGKNVYGFLPNNLNGHMTGTSFSTAIKTGKLINEISKKECQ